MDLKYRPGAHRPILFQRNALMKKERKREEPAEMTSVDVTGVQRSSSQVFVSSRLSNYTPLSGSL